MSEIRALQRCEESRATYRPGVLIKGVLKVIPGHCHLFEMETSCKWHFPSVCDCSHPPLPASLGPCTRTYFVPCRASEPRWSGGCDEGGGLQRRLNLAEACRLVQAVPGLDTPGTLGSPIPPFLAGRDVSPASGLLGSKSASNATTPGLQARLHPRFPGLSRRRSAGHPEGSQLHACRMTATRSAALGKTSCHHKLHRSVFPLSPAYPSGSQSFVNLNKRESCLLKSLAASRVYFRSNLATFVLQILTAEAVGGAALTLQILRIPHPAREVPCEHLGFSPEGFFLARVPRRSRPGGPAQEEPWRMGAGG